MFNLIRNKIQPCNDNNSGQNPSPPNTTTKCSVCLEEGLDILTTCRGGDHCHLCCECTFTLITRHKIDKCPVCRETLIEGENWMIYDMDVLRRDQNVSNVTIVHNYNVTNINVERIVPPIEEPERRNLPMHCLLTFLFPMYQRFCRINFPQNTVDIETGNTQIATNHNTLGFSSEEIQHFFKYFQIGVALTFISYLIGLLIELFLFPNEEMASFKPRKIMINILTGATLMGIIKCCCNCRGE